MIFAYGCTGSGKTHTLQGTNASPGLIPRTVQCLFASGGDSSTTATATAISVSYFEILKDKVWDLLSAHTPADRSKGDLAIRENAQGRVFVAQLTESLVSSVEDFDRLFVKASKARTTAATKLNHASSRSHAVLTLTVRRTVEGKTTAGKCTLIDLAGSEDNKKTGNEGRKERMKESVEINQSLLTLRKVVTALNSGDVRPLPGSCAQLS